MGCQECGTPCNGSLCQFHRRERYRDWSTGDENDDEEVGDDG